MNEAQQQAINDAIANSQDNLYRFRLQQKAMPNWVTGNGEPIATVIEYWEKQVAQLKGE